MTDFYKFVRMLCSMFPDKDIVITDDSTYESNLREYKTIHDMSLHYKIHRLRNPMECHITSTVCKEGVAMLSGQLITRWGKYLLIILIKERSA